MQNKQSGKSVGLKFKKKFLEKNTGMENKN
jgi:hypothetical protein